MRKNNTVITIAVALTLVTLQSIASNDLQITRTGIDALAVSAQFGGTNISVGKQIVPFGNHDTMMTSSASRILKEKSYNSIIASKQFGATNFNVWLGDSKTRGLSASYAGNNWQLGASAVQYTTKRTVLTIINSNPSSENTLFIPPAPQQDVSHDPQQGQTDGSKDEPVILDATATTIVTLAEYNNLKIEYINANADNKNSVVALKVTSGVWSWINNHYRSMNSTHDIAVSRLNSLRQRIVTTKERIKEYQQQYEHYSSKHDRIWMSAYNTAAGIALYKKGKEQEKLAIYEANIVSQRAIVRDLALGLKAIKTELDKSLAAKLKAANKHARLVNKVEKLHILLEKARLAVEKAKREKQERLSNANANKDSEIEYHNQQEKEDVVADPNISLRVEYRNVINSLDTRINNKLSTAQIAGKAMNYTENTKHTAISLHGSYSFDSGISVLAKHVSLQTKSKSEVINSLEVQYLVRDDFVVGIRKESSNEISNNAVTVATKYAVGDNKSIQFEHRKSSIDNNSTVKFSLNF